MKRLPTPASGNSIDTSSGVSMLSWSPTGSMAIILSNQWLQKRRPYWDRLAALLSQAGTGGGVRQLSRAELRETALLYRQAASDLSTLRQDPTARTTPSTSTNYWLAPTISSIRAGAKAS